MNLLSFDYELNWGLLENNICVSEDTSSVLIEMLSILKERNIDITVSFVGAIGLTRQEFLREHNEENYINYQGFARDTRLLSKLTKNTEQLFFSPKTIELLLRDHRIKKSSHTFTHIFRQFDLSSAALSHELQIFKKYYPDVSHIIFCGNQYDDQYVNIAQSFGFNSYRKNATCNSDIYLFEEANHTKFLKRSLEIFPINFSIDKERATRFLRPIRNERLTTLYFNMLRKEQFIGKILGKNFHYWAHPHNVSGATTFYKRELMRFLLDISV